MIRKLRSRSCLLAIGGVLLALALTMYMSIPYAPESATELYGTYYSDHEGWQEVLVLHPDGSFTQTAKGEGAVERRIAKRRSITGRWEYRSVGYLDGDVSLYGFLLNGRPSAADEPDTPGTVVIPAQYWLGTLWVGDPLGDWSPFRKVE